VIITDVLMPRCDGYHLCRAVREDPDLADTPVILMGTDAVDGDRALAQSVGASAFVVRTPDLREVTDALRTLLAQEPGGSGAEQAASRPAGKRSHASPAVRISHRSRETAGEAADVSPAEDAPSEVNRPAPPHRPRRRREDVLPSSTDRALPRKRRPARRQD
jgi:DNA-binding response OmpR family regulator